MTSSQTGRMKFRFLGHVCIRGNTLTRLGLLMSLVHKVGLGNLTGKESRQEAVCSHVGSFVTSTWGLGGGRAARGCACFSVSAFPAPQADGSRRLGNNWTPSSSRRSRPKRPLVPFGYGSGHRGASRPIHAQFDTTSRNCEVAAALDGRWRNRLSLTSCGAGVTES